MLPVGTSIVIAGPVRSGTTRLYNLARLALEAAGLEPEAGWWPHFNARLGQRSYLFKTHRPAEALADRADLVVCTRRDLRDAYASAVRMGFSPDTPEAAVKYVGRYCVAPETFWHPRADLTVAYETGDATEALLDLLGLDADAETLRRRVEALKPPRRRRFDPRTCLFREHRTGVGVGGYRQVLSCETIAAIETAYRDWLYDRGYGVPDRDRGLGDTVEALLDATGVGPAYKAVHRRLTGRPCGCARRKATLNRWGRRAGKWLGQVLG